MAIFNNSRKKFKIHAELSKVWIGISKSNDRRDRRKDKFFPGEYMLVVLSMQRVTLRWLVGITVAIKKLNAAVHDKYD